VDCGRRDGTGAGEAAFSRAAADGPLVPPAAVPLVPAEPPEPVAARPATVPPAMMAQAPSVTNTTRMGARGGLEPERPERLERLERLEPACLPLAPETDVLTTIPIVSRAASARQGRARR